MGFMQYYKTAKNIPNPHSKIEYFIHITSFKNYPPKKKRAMIFGLYLLGNGVLCNLVIIVSELLATLHIGIKLLLYMTTLVAKKDSLHGCLVPRSPLTI